MLGAAVAHCNYGQNNQTIQWPRKKGKVFILTDDDDEEEEEEDPMRIYRICPLVLKSDIFGSKKPPRGRKRCFWRKRKKDFPLLIEGKVGGMKNK